MKKLLGLLAAILILAGCGEGDERRHPLFLKGERAQTAGNGKEAAECFAELLKRRPHGIYVHIKLASVYDELLKQPLSAAYHYRQYLLHYPDAPDAEEVRSWLDVCEKRCYEDLKKRFEVSAESIAEAKSVSADSELVPEPDKKTADSADKTPTGDIPANEAAQKEIAELKSLLEQYRIRHRMVMQELEKLRRSAAQVSVSKPETAPAPPDNTTTGAENQVAVYRILPGDTPGKIARKVYGKSSLYTIILRANPGLDERKLRPGMTIKLPPRPDNN